MYRLFLLPQMMMMATGFGMMEKMLRSFPGARTDTRPDDGPDAARPRGYDPAPATRQVIEGPATAV